MANHKSAVKRIRQNSKRRVHNRYFARTARNAVNEFKEMTDKKKAEKKLPEVVSMVDRLARRNIIHKNKAANLKSQLYKHVDSL